MKPKYFLFFFLTFFIFNCSLLIATVRYVSKTGSSTPPYTSWETASDSIQKCINICSFGDTIYVANGVYKENLVINTAISLIGSSMDSTVIDGRGMGDYTIVFSNGGTIENFNIYGKDISTLSGRVIRSITMFTFLEVKNCRLSDSGVGVSMLGGDLKANNLFINSVTRGFNLFGENLNEISNCYISLGINNSIGISIGFAPNVSNYIRNNIILFTGRNNSEAGIAVGGAKSVYIKNNLISRFHQSIFFDTVIDTGYIKNNILVYQSGQGASSSIWSSGNRLFANNIILSNNIRGIYQSGSGVIHSDYNIFWQNEQDMFGLNYGDSDRVADPMFAKDTIPTPDGSFDFHLQKYSPAIDRGDPNILDVDGSRSDIGMFGGPFGETYTYQDLAPLAPRNLSAVVDTNNITVRWRKNTEADTSFYNVYRDTVSGFQIDSTKLVSTLSDTFFVQINPHNVTKYVYKITCVDNQGNESKPSQELVVNITSVSTDNYPMTISDYVLYQNYPNPFNPSTKIGYQLKERAYVKLMVYDIKGELFSVLMNKEQNAGYYEVEFNADVRGEKQEARNNIASGIYLYRIEVIGEGKIPVYTEMKKMLLIK